MSEQPIKIHELDVKRFNALMTGSRSPALGFFAEETAWYANEDETILGVLAFDLADHDVAVVLLVRDLARRYRYFEGRDSFVSTEAARDWLVRAMKWHTGQGLTVYSHGDENKPINLFQPVVPEDKQHVSYRDLATMDAFLSARKMINELMPHFVDVDGNFVREFQTRGFDARLWELYLHAYLLEERLFVEREHPSPDFLVRKYGHSVGIEAVIVGRKEEYSPKVYLEEPPPLSQEEIESKNLNEIPIRFGSSLYTKLQKRYWELPHLRGIPLVFAIADFHDDRSMLWTSAGLMHYLYGLRHTFAYDTKGNLVVTPHRIDAHRLGEKVIPSGFFLQPDADHVSAVLFSASGTISKFNRIGRQAGFKHPNVTMLRVGMCHDHDPNACVPKLFRYEVDERSSETWSEGMSIFHNPHARYPVPRELFPSIAHHDLKNGMILSELPDFHPYGSNTLIFQSRDQ